MRLFHFSDRGNIDVFQPQSPTRHPDWPPRVYAIEEAFQSLYLFPRECPRIAHWTDESEIHIFLDVSWESRWRTEAIWRYELASDGFVHHDANGTWVSDQTVWPIGMDKISDLPGATNAQIHIVDSLLQKAKEFYDFGEKRFLVEGHVSMIRLSNLLA